MQQHFVEFLSPGTLFAERTAVPIDSWDVEKAQEMAHDIKERYNATPYGFQFTTRSRKDSDLDSKETARSRTYFLGGVVETLAEVEAREPSDSILVINMRCNGFNRVITNTNSWKTTQPLRDDDVVLDWTPRTVQEG